jgi:hypothetical protein
MKKKKHFGASFLRLLGLRGSKRPLQSKETAGGCFGGRVRVGERESEPSESRNPLHNKKERQRRSFLISTCFHFRLF